MSFLKDLRLKPDFDKKWFEKHQDALVTFANSRLGRWFFAFKAVDIPKNFRVMQMFPGAMTGDWKIVNGKLQKTLIAFTSNRFQNRLEYVCSKAAARQNQSNSRLIFV